MQVDITKLPKSKIQIKIKLSGEEFSPYLIEAIKEISKNLDISGFRPGKVPLEVAKEKISEEQILEEAANIALNKKFSKIVQDRKLKILGSPKAEIKKISREEFESLIEVAIFPEAELPDYKKIAKTEPKNKVNIKSEEVKDSLSRLQKSRAKYVRVSRPAEKGDQIEIDYEIRSGGVKIGNGDIKNQKIILGENSGGEQKETFIPGFEKNLISMKEKEEKEFSIHVPSDFWKKELQRKLLDFRVKMTGVFKIELLEINDEFAVSLGEFKNLKSLENSILEGIKAEKENEEKIRWQNSVLEKISKESKIELPDILVEKERDRMLEEFKKRTGDMGLSFETYLLHLKKTIEDLKNDFLSEAEKKVRILLCIYKISEEENIKAEEKEIEEEMNKIIKKSPELTRKIQDQKNFKSYLEESIMQKKTISFLQKIADSSEEK